MIIVAIPISIELIVILSICGLLYLLKRVMALLLYVQIVIIIVIVNINVVPIHTLAYPIHVRSCIVTIAIFRMLTKKRLLKTLVLLAHLSIFIFILSFLFVCIGLYICPLLMLDANVSDD